MLKRTKKLSIFDVTVNISKHTIFFIMAKMSNYVPTKQHLREDLLLFFNLRKSTTEARRLLSEAYAEYAPEVRVCQQCFARFKSNDFDTEDKERSGPSKKFED